jgi:hypothetical protein
MRFGGQQVRVDVRCLPAAARRPIQRRAVRGFVLAEEQVVWFALDYLAGLEAERLRARVPPAM